MDTKPALPAPEEYAAAINLRVRLRLRRRRLALGLSPCEAAIPRKLTAQTIRNIELHTAQQTAMSEAILAIRAALNGIIINLAAVERHEDGLGLVGGLGF